MLSSPSHGPRRVPPPYGAAAAGDLSSSAIASVPGSTMSALVTNANAGLNTSGGGSNRNSPQPPLGSLNLGRSGAHLAPQQPQQQQQHHLLGQAQSSGPGSPAQSHHPQARHSLVGSGGGGASASYSNTNIITNPLEQQQRLLEGVGLFQAAAAAAAQQQQGVVGSIISMSSSPSTVTGGIGSPSQHHHQQQHLPSTGPHPTIPVSGSSQVPDDNGGSGGKTTLVHRQQQHRGSRSPHQQNHSGSGGHPSHDQDDIVEVQILPQDDNWPDNTTCITGATSERSLSAEDVSRLGSSSGGWPGRGGGGVSLGGAGASSRSLSGLFVLHMWLGSVVAAVLSVAALLSPLVMLLLPRLASALGEQPWKVQACGPECDGLLIGFAFKLCILFGGCWAVFFRRPRATMPRVFVFRALVIALTIVFLVSYWLFYSVRIYERRHDDFDLTYLSIVQFALSLIDTLLFVHYLAVLLLELRHLQPQYFVKVVRSPDGASRSYTLGAISIQRAAVQLLENYYRDFPVYNPFLEQLPAAAGGSASGASLSSTSGKKHQQLQQQLMSQGSFKMYDLNGGSTGGSDGHHHHHGHHGHHHGQQVPPLSAGINSGGGGGGRRTSDRLFAEHEYEKRVKKRRARLVTAAEDAFTHIRRVQENVESTTQIVMDSHEAAQAVFPSMARALQKYLRITRQQPRHTMQGILDHLATCLHYDLSPKTFLEKYLRSEPVLQDERELTTSIQSWALVCDVLLSRPVKSGVSFILRQGDVSLIATVYDLPHFNITEEVVDPKCNKFVLRLQSETSV